MTSLARVLLMVAALALVDCRQTPSTPPRPATVPATAMWVGGLDGGMFLEFGKKAGDPKQVYEVVVYNDFTGTVEFKGKLRLNSGEIAPSSFGDPKFFSAWDGDRLHLVDGRHLTAIPKGSAKSK